MGQVFVLVCWEMKCVCWEMNGCIAGQVFAFCHNSMYQGIAYVLYNVLLHSELSCGTGLTECHGESVSWVSL